jgi:hypothetical protein
MPKKQLTQDEIAQAVNDLQDKKSPKRRAAAKKIGKNGLLELGDALLTAYLKEREDKRTWETQTEMILAFGKIRYQPALPYLKVIIDINTPEDMITHAAARSYVRIKRDSLNDAKPVLELLLFGEISVIDGATSALAYDDMTPPEEEIKAIIALLDSHKEEELSISGLMDPRTYLLSCLRKCKNQTSADYINRFINSSDRDLRHCAEIAKVGKKARFE